MIHKTSKHIFRQHLVTAWILLCSHLALSAVPYLQGQVLSSGTSRGIDSVRITSRRFNTVTYSNRLGLFTLTRPIDSTCMPDTTVLDSSFQYSVSLSRRTPSDNFTRPRSDIRSLSLFDLHGRLLSRNYFSSEKKHSPTRKLPNGIIIAAIDHRFPRRHLHLTHEENGYISLEKKLTCRVALPECLTTDTLYFYRQGYQPADLPVYHGTTPQTVRLTPQRWIASDLHNHSILTDGIETLDTLCKKSFSTFGLDVYANSEHGGTFSTDTTGLYIVNNPAHQNAPAPMSPGYVSRWYSLIHFAWPKVLNQRRYYPEKLLYLGLEWDSPGHEHVSVGFINDQDQPDAVAEFEYRFDADDPDTSRGKDSKANAWTHVNSVAAMAWLQKNYAGRSYCFINHPSRENSGPNPIAMFRDFHNTAPDVFLGLEGMPGHHKHILRGKYARQGKLTIGGADPTVATIGGLWDALLGEGRRLWILVNSDFHNTGQDFWPGEYAKTWVAVTDTGLNAFLKGMQSGTMFAVHGDIISALVFTVSDGTHTVQMGDDLHTSHSHLTIGIRFRSPPRNNHGDEVHIDHIDLLRGDITGRVSPSDPDYNTPRNPSTTRIAQFTSDDWTVAGEWNSITFETTVTGSSYFRLRGTSLPAGMPGETDSDGNPLPDKEYSNNESIAWHDLWFYSNPVFIYQH